MFYAAMESYVGGCLCSLRVGGSGGMEVGGGGKKGIRALWGGSGIVCVWVLGWVRMRSCVGGSGESFFVCVCLTGFESPSVHYSSLSIFFYLLGFCFLCLFMFYIP